MWIYRVEKAGDDPQVDIVASWAHNTQGSIEQLISPLQTANILQVLT